MPFSEQLARAKRKKGPLSLYHLIGDGSSDCWLLALTEFMSSMHALIPPLDRPSYGDLEDTNMTIQKLLRWPEMPRSFTHFSATLRRGPESHMARTLGGGVSRTSCPCNPGASRPTEFSTSGSSSDLSQTYRSPTETGYEPLSRPPPFGNRDLSLAHDFVHKISSADFG
ncbi:hypothetical protein BC826DRAFT_357492 [Russula brevipes]|nr:hypothetical protein BC826DRAFT_357492 [Russula brevipes]